MVTCSILYYNRIGLQVIERWENRLLYLQVLQNTKKYCVIRVLSQSPISSSCKQNWSVLKAAYTKLKHDLSPKMFNDDWKINSLEIRDMLPIDLEKLDEPIGFKD